MGFTRRNFLKSLSVLMTAIFAHPVLKRTTAPRFRDDVEELQYLIDHFETVTLDKGRTYVFHRGQTLVMPPRPMTTILCDQTILYADDPSVIFFTSTKDSGGFTLNGGAMTGISNAVMTATSLPQPNRAERRRTKHATR